MLKPLNIVYEELLKFPKTKKMMFFLSQTNFLIFNRPNDYIRIYHIPYIIFNILPRIIVIFALSYDIYQLYFNYFYKSLVLLLFPLCYHLLISKCYEYYMVFLKEHLSDKFIFIPINALTFTMADSFLYSNDLNFTFSSALPEAAKKKTFLDFGYMIYKFTLFNYLFLELEKNFNIQIINKLINYIFAMLWWYLLFHILLYAYPLEIFSFTVFFDLLYLIYFLI